MESPGCMGLMAVMAVSGSVALVAVQLHRRLAAEFMEKVHLELETGGVGGCRPAKKPLKKVRFAADVVEPSSNNEEYRRRRWRHHEARPEIASCREYKFEAAECKPSYCTNEEEQDQSNSQRGRCSNYIKYLAHLSNLKRRFLFFYFSSSSFSFL